MKINYQPIGVIHSPFKDTANMPIQPTGANGIRGSVEVLPEFLKGLKDLDGFSHIVLIYHFHRAKESKLVVTPFLDSQPRGVFATRAPTRPNPIGLSVVKLLAVERNVLQVENVDVLDETPLLDIKPCVPQFDHPPVTRIGWIEHTQASMADKKSDGRFSTTYLDDERQKRCQ